MNRYEIPTYEEKQSTVELQGVEGFEERLILLNTQHSLAICHPVVLKRYYNEGKEFTPKEQQIYDRLRQEEVMRIAKSINELNSYEEKLSFLLNVKGFTIDRGATLWTNESDAIIDLTPRTDEEKWVYLKVSWVCFDKIYRTSNGFSEDYKGFDFEKRKQDFEIQIKNSVEKNTLIEHLIQEIKEAFKNGQYIKEPQNILLKKYWWFYQLTTKGKSVELGQSGLGFRELLEYTHVLEVVKFYKYLREYNLNVSHPSNPSVVAPVQIESPRDKVIIEIKPVFKSNAIPHIFDILKDFFDPVHHPQLQNLLITGDDIETPILFKDNGNRLADTFKKLIKSDIITGCLQTELASWIGRNFEYRSRGKVKKFTLHYLEDIISTPNEMCKKPIIENYWIEKYR
jgi:hypothetical protein